jgi:hypothetical protein
MRYSETLLEHFQVGFQIGALRAAVRDALTRESLARQALVYEGPDV